MWGRSIGETWGEGKLHFFIHNESACTKVKLTPDSYVQYTEVPEKREDACKDCLNELQKSMFQTL